MKKLYVGNISFQTTEDELREAFSQFGTVTSAQVVMDRDTGRSRGFAFVEMSEGGEQAVEAGPGEFLHVPAWTVHREANPTDEVSTAVIARAGRGAPTVNADGPDPS